MELGAEEGLYWPVVVITLSVFLVLSEYGSQDCTEQQCHMRASSISPGDDKTTAINKVLAAVENNHTVVNWRRSMLISILVALAILFVASPHRLPSGRVFLLVCLVVFSALYLFSTLDQNLHWAPVDEEIKNLLHRL